MPKELREEVCLAIVVKHRVWEEVLDRQVMVGCLVKNQTWVSRVRLPLEVVDLVPSRQPQQVDLEASKII